MESFEVSFGNEVFLGFWPIATPTGDSLVDPRWLRRGGYKEALQGKWGIRPVMR
jgi:hypothetical protein